MISSNIPGFIAAFPFIHPAIAAAAAVSGLIPILVHLFHRRRHRRVPWAAMRFLIAATQRNARRVWLEQWFLLFLRVLLIVLTGLAIARPYFPSSILPLSSARVHRVIVIDDSFSMNALRSDGGSRFDAAKACAARLLSSFPTGDGLSLVTMASPVRAVIEHAAYDRRFVREQLAALTCTQRQGDTAGAIALAAKIVRESNVPVANRTVYILSDMPIRDWRNEGSSRSGAALAMRSLAETLSNPERNLVVVNLNEPSARNLAIVRFVADTSLIGVGVPVRLVADVVNDSPESVRDLECQLRIGGEIARRERIQSIAAGQRTSVLFTLTFPSAGTHLLESRIVGAPVDALAEDDSRLLSIEARSSAPVLVVDGRPGVTPLQGEAGFFATALAPMARTAGDELGVSPGSATRLVAVIEPKIISDSELRGEPLQNYDILALCNVCRLPADSWKKIERFVSEGGGLFVSGGDLVDVDDYNRNAYRQGEGVLPGMLARDEQGQDESAGGLGFKLVGHHRAVAEFAVQAASGLFTARVQRFLPVVSPRGSAEVLLQFTNDRPAVILSRFGRGHVVLWTTSVDLKWTNLPAKGDFVSLLLNLVGELAPSRGLERNIQVGETLRERLTAVQSTMPVRIAAESGALSEPALMGLDEGLAAEFGPIEHRGVVRMSIGSELRHFAVNVAADESVQSGIDSRSFAMATERGHRWIDDPDQIGSEMETARATELSVFFVALVFVLLFAEMTIAARLGAPVRADRAHGRRTELQPSSRVRVAS